MTADPKLMPFTCGILAGAVAPPGIKMFAGLKVTSTSLLVSMTIAPPEGAGAARVTGNSADIPTPTTVGLAGKMI